MSFARGTRSGGGWPHCEICGGMCFALSDEIEVDYVATPLENMIESLMKQFKPLGSKHLQAETEEKHMPEWVLRERVMACLTFCHLQHENTVVNVESVEVLRSLLPNTAPNLPAVFPPEEFDPCAAKEARELHQKRPHITILDCQDLTLEAKRSFDPLPDQVRFHAVQTCVMERLACLIINAVDQVFKTLELNFGPLHVTMLCDLAFGTTAVEYNYLLQYDDVEVRDVQTVVNFAATRSSCTPRSCSRQEITSRCQHSTEFFEPSGRCCYYLLPFHPNST